MKKIISKKIIRYTLPYEFSIDIIRNKLTTDFFMSNKFYRHKMHMFGVENKSLEDIMSTDELVVQNAPEYMDNYIKYFGDEDDLGEYIEFFESSIGKPSDFAPKKSKKIISALILSDDYAVEFEDSDEFNDIIDFYLVHTDHCGKFHVDSAPRGNITSLKEYIQDNIPEYIQLFLEDYNDWW